MLAGDLRSPGEMTIGSKRVTIDVPDNKYEILKQIAEEKSSSIRALVREGVDLIILDNRSLLNEMAERSQKEAEQKSLNIKDVLSSLEK